MPRPATKTALSAASQMEFDALQNLLAAYNAEQLIQPGALGEWSAKDTLAHLHEWHQMVQHWYSAGLRGETPAVPGEGYSWAQLPALNQQIFLRYRDLPFEEVSQRLQESHAAQMALIESLSESDLFTPGLYPWMRQNTLAAYFTSNGSSHYRWARTELRKGLKKLTLS
jgi:hypothetical protein